MKKAKVSKYGQWKYPGQDTIIPNANGSITMKGVPYPVLGIDDQGNQQMMMPGGEYQFPGNSVYEMPMMAAGGLVNPCPPGQVPDGQGGCIDDLSTPPIPSSSLYNYYMENLNKFKASGLNNAEEIVGKMVKSKRTCKPGDECWEEPEVVKPPVVNDPNIQKVIFNTDKGDIYKVQDRKTKRLIRYEDFNGNPIDINNPNGTPANEFYDRGPNAQPGLMPGKEMKRVAIPSGGFKEGGDISIPNLRPIKIKSLPKAQSGPSSSGLTPEQQQNYEDQYLVYRDQGDSPRAANNLAFNDASYFGSDPIYNLQSFLPNPDSGVRVASGKRFPYEHIDPKTFDPWEENYMSDPEYVARYNKMTPDQQRMAQDNVYKSEGLDTYNYNLDNVKKWEKNWYSKRATLPQFTDIANQRLSLVENINMQPYGNVAEYQNMMPGSGGVYMPSKNAISIPSSSFAYPSTIAHERSHWYDWNAPQNDDMYNGSYLRSYLNPGTIANPVYNDEDAILNNILPSEYKMPYGTAQPLRSGENDANTYDSETEKIIANLPTASDEINVKTVKIPFKNQQLMFGDTRGNLEYYTEPTEVRARLNEWRLQHNIDPTKDYSNEELQQIIDKDLENKNSNNFDLYKVIQGRGDLLKQINDSYVSTGNKENPDEMPKAQTMGNVKKGKTLFGRPYQVVETEAGPTASGYERPGETTRVKTVYYKDGNIAKQKIDNNEKGGDEVTWHDKDGKVTAEKTSSGYRTFSNGYFDYTNNVDYETTKRRNDEVENISPKNKLQGFVQRAKLNLENMSREGSQPGDSYNTVWPDWENDRFNYTREKNPDVRKSRAKFEYGGIPRAQDGLPTDYESFLKYSETAPENRRPDSEWQYGNPRQYDHYGMWDALGKPENFNQALEKNPQWQPDPYDNMYHGFSTNPNTGVWLKSHIPGESHPGDTGWMEYKDFMLSNDRNWGGKNQNLVYDSDLQRMRYVDRKKAGGALTKAQNGWLGDMIQKVAQQPTQSTPGVFEQVNQFSNFISENVKPDANGSDLSLYNKYIKPLQTLKPEQPKPFSIPDDYYKNLMHEENSINAGLKGDRYYQYPSHEKGTDTIGYGHKLTKEEEKENKFSKGLTKDEALALMRNDVEEHLTRATEQYNQKFGNDAFNKLHPDLKVLALDFVYNGIPIEKFPTFFGAANKYSTTKDANAKKIAYDTMMKEYIRYDDKDVPLGSRNEYTKRVLTNIKETGGAIRQVKIKSLPKAQTMGAFSDWRNIFDYKNAAEPRQNLVGDVRKVKVDPIAAESTLPNKTVKTPDSWKGRTTKDIKAEADAQIAYDALPEELKRRDTLTADTRSDAEKFARRAWTAVSQPMETIAAINKGYDIPSGYLGMGDAYEGYNVGSLMTSVVDMAGGLPAFIGNATYRQGEKIVNNPLEYLAVNTLGLFDPKTRGEALGNYFDLSAVIPAAGLASPLIRSAVRSTSKVSKPSLLTQASRNNPAKYEDDLFRYLADSEASSGVDRNYLMSLSDDVYGRQQVIGADLRNPNYNVDQDLLRGWLAEDARINNRLMPPPNEITFDGSSFTDTYSNPFDVNNIVDLTRAGSSSSLRDRLVGRLSDTYRRFARATADDVPISQVRNEFRNFRGSTPAGQPVPTNKSYLTKEETKALVKDKTELDKLNKLNDTEFRDILITPDGKIKFPEKYKGPKQIATMEVEEYVNDFNDNLDLLNDIIRRNNTSGRDYTVTGLTKDGQLKFRTDDGRTSYMSTGITPGRFRGDIQDVASMDYMANAIPGLRMEGASPIFGDAVRGTGTYKSLNEYLKTLDLGRIKSGMNSQSQYSRPLWENAIKKGDAFGYYASPRTVYGIMKKEGGTKKKKPGFQVLTDANGKYVFVKT